MSEQRVVVTGLGAVTPVGIGVEAFWQGLQAGKNGIARVTHFDPTGFRSQLAAEVKDFDPQEWIDKKSIERMDRFTQFAVAAAAMAMKDAGLDNYGFDKCRAGVIIGSGIGGSASIEEGHYRVQEKGPNSLTPFFVSKLLINMAACMVSVRFGLKGPLSAPSVACSTGANAIGEALRILQRGDAEVMLAGSSEAAVTPLAYAGFCATRSMSANPNAENASRPFDRNRDGFIMGEGSGVVVLERREHAIQRQAKIYAELVGYGNTADAFHFTAPEPSGDGMIRVMKAALKDAAVEPGEVDYINAHGTSTLLNDKIESAAIMNVFGSHAKVLKVSSNKSMIGHLLAAAGAVEFIATVLSVHSGIVPPTINYTEPDPDCPLDYVTQGAEALAVRFAASNSFGFGGGNACLVVKKGED
ncbi:MAG TPA: beta-ketoacyl-ACP synthase II [Patescibacteria group bacterium]|nr:beta-ketoacyl-ACP synthase II [Patescibacteria group bacterium]